MVKIKFLDKNGNFKKIEAKEGANLLEVSKQYNINLEGTCDGEMRCSSCHIHILSKHINKIKRQSLEEKELLALAENLKKNSRLSCQIEITNYLDGLIFCIA